MLDIEYVRNNPDALKENIKRRHLQGDQFDVDAFLTVDKQRNELIQQVDALRARRNELSDVQGKPSPEVIEKGREIKEQLKALEDDLDALQKTWQWHMDWFPNIPHDAMPDGEDEQGNLEIKRWGDLTKHDFEARSHHELGALLDIIDTDKSGEIAGSRFSFLKNEAALLHWALISFSTKKLVQAGFSMMIPPVILKQRALYGTGYFPAEGDQIYELEQGDVIEDDQRRFLAGTSEQALIAYHMDDVLEESDLPLRYGGVSSCFRSEAGSWGKDVRGIKRVHQFDKVEMIYFTTPETSQKYMQEALQIEEEILQELGLTYHVLEMCTGDVGLPTHRKFDLEVWLPSQQTWMETHSNSDLASYHTRRLNIRYRDANGELRYPHTLSATAITNTRPIAAILDTYQQKDGSVVVPEVLREYVGKDKIVVKE